jgi:ketosteroid isomerase-like protein
VLIRVDTIILAWNYSRLQNVQTSGLYLTKEFSMNLKRSLYLSPFVALVLLSLRLHAQSSAQPETLFKTIQSLDTQLFDAYNHCDLTALGALVADDLEFYHDQTGLSVGKAPFIAAIKQNICGKVERTIVPGSMEVYPLKGYGAVQIGVDHFHQQGHPEDRGGDAKFVTLWQNKDGAWKVTRVISFNHNSVAK